MQHQTPRALFSPIGMDGRSENNRGDWKKVAVHNLHEIRGFFGSCEWLSNTHRANVFYFGMRFSSAESAYQAAKVFPEERRRFQSCPPFEAMKLGDELPPVVPLSWHGRKIDVMRTILFRARNKMSLVARLRSQPATAEGYFVTRS